jgi:hypothetical protein
VYHTKEALDVIYDGIEEGNVGKVSGGVATIGFVGLSSASVTAPAVGTAVTTVLGTAAGAAVTTAFVPVCMGAAVIGGSLWLGKKLYDEIINS